MHLAVVHTAGRSLVGNRHDRRVIGRSTVATPYRDGCFFHRWELRWHHANADIGAGAEMDKRYVSVYARCLLLAGSDAVGNCPGVGVDACFRSQKRRLCCPSRVQDAAGGGWEGGTRTELEPSFLTRQCRAVRLGCFQDKHSGKKMQ
jgi:hypothetical protein